MAAAESGLMPGKIEKIQSFLQEAAVGDASHDFSDSRAGGNLFNTIFKKYKDIGAPSFPSGVEEPMSEFEILNNVFQFAPEGTKESDLIAKFRQNILVNNKEQTFNRWDEDKIPYKMTTKLVAKKQKGGEYDWQLTSKEMFDFMKGSKSDMAFTVDATNVPFYDRMLEKKGEQTAAGSYIYMRESVNDAATKVIIPKTTDTVVGIQTIEDTASFNVMYPAVRSTSSEEISKLSEQELFYSNYSLALASDPKKSSPSVTLSFYDKQMIRQIQILKGRKEDAHPNSVPTLSNKIRELTQYLTPKGNLNKKMEYFTALQQKRSGDWLQVLGCLQPERFGLAASTRITLVTLDKICVAYALFSGVDVMMTYFYMNPDPDKPNEYWMIRIYKDYQATPETKEAQLTKIIQFYPRPESIDTFIADGQKNGYTAYKHFYLNSWDSINTKLKNEVHASIQKINNIVFIERFDTKKFVQNYITPLLDTATTLAVFRSLAPEIDTTYPNEEVHLYTQAITSSSYTTILSKFEKFKKNYTTLKNAILSKKTSALSTEHAIQSYFTSIYNKNKLNTKTHKDRFELISKLQIFGKLFSSRNGGKNGVGIFTFLSIHLRSEEAKKLRDAILTSINHIPDDLKDQYMEFINTANLLLGEDVPIQQITVENKDILESVNSQFSNQTVNITGIKRKRSPQSQSHYQFAPPSKAASKAAAVAAAATANTVSAATTIETVEKEYMELIDNEHISEEAKDIISKHSLDIEPDNSFQISDYTAALTLLSLRFAYIQTPKGQYDLEDFIQKNKVPDLVAIGGSRRSKQFSRRSVRKITQSFTFHNPYITFYFLLRELSYRLSMYLDEEEENYTIRIVNMILTLIRQKDSLIKLYSNEFEFKGNKYTSIPIVLEYMLFTSIEQYILYKSDSTNLLSIPSYYWKDLISSYLQGYLDIKKLHYTKDKIFLPENIIQTIFLKTSIFINKKDLIDAALLTMNTMVKYVGNLDMRLSFLKSVKSIRKTRKMSGKIRSAQPFKKIRSSKSTRSAKAELKSKSKKSRQPSRRSVKASQRQSSQAILKKEPAYNIQINQNIDPIQKQITPYSQRSQKIQSINSENPIEVVNY